jgi:hypothetical protein
MKLLSTKDLPQIGDHYGLVLKNSDGISSLLSFAWMDHNRRIFIAFGRTLSDGRVELKIAKPKAAEVFYSAFTKIDHPTVSGKALHFLMEVEA